MTYRIGDFHYKSELVSHLKRPVGKLTGIPDASSTCHSGSSKQQTCPSLSGHMASMLRIETIIKMKHEGAIEIKLR
jgi:hypothetical protein